MGKLFFILLFSIISTEIHAEFNNLIKEQIILIQRLNDTNLSKKDIEVVQQRQVFLYTEAIENFLKNKHNMLSQPLPYISEIFYLKKKIKYNKRYGYKYAVLRDEILLKSFSILKSNYKMAKDILRLLDYYSLEEFAENMNKKFVENQLEIDKIIHNNPIIIFDKKDDNQKIFKDIEKNLKDYHAILEINTDISNYFAINQNRLYRLNRYEQYKILNLALYFDHIEWVKRVNEILKPYDISITKIFLISIISLFIYLVRTKLYRLIELLLLRIQFFKKYTDEILGDIRIPINYLLLSINLQIMLYIYNNFSATDIITKIFNISYSLLFTLIIYRILNTVASIRINDIEKSNRVVKSEMINVGIKIINFMILILGLLLILHFAGANLATVLSGLGIGGFAIAIAARESLSNFLGTISILMSDVFSQGDWIVVEGHEGTVVEIGLRVTTIRTFDNALIAIPNGTIANKEVKNWSKRTLGRRIKMSLTLKYGSKPQNIRNAILEIREMLQNHPDIATEKTYYQENKKKKNPKLVSQEDALGVKRTLFVYLDEFSDSSINILVYCFTKKIIWGQWLEAKEDIMYKIMEILEHNSLEFAFPSLSLYQEQNSDEKRGL